MAPAASARSNLSTRDANVGACASYAFQDPLTRANLAFDGIYILGGLIILVAYIIQAVRKGAVRKAAPWYLFGIGIFLWTLSQALYTASFVIQQCDATTYGNPVLPINLDIASNWLCAVSMILFLATALLPICAQLYRSQESIAFQRLKWAHVIILVVFAALYISSIAYLTWIIETPDYDDFYFTSYYAVPLRQIIYERLAAARSFIQGIAALVAGSTIIGAWNISRRQGSRSTGLLIGTIIFMLALFVDSMGTFGLYIAEMVTAINGTDSSLSYTGESAAFLVFNVLELVAWAALFVVACSKAMGQSSFNGDKPYQYAPAPFHSGNGAPEVMNTEYQPQTGFGPQQTSYDSVGPRQDYQTQQQQQNRNSMGVSPVSPQMGQQQYQAYTPQTGAGQQHAY